MASTLITKESNSCKKEMTLFIFILMIITLIKDSIFKFKFENLIFSLSYYNYQELIEFNIFK